MKVIDLLNKIANKERVPEEIEFNNKAYIKYNDGDYDFYYAGIGDLLMENLGSTDLLNEEVRVVEEAKKIEIDEKGYLHTSEGSFKGRKMDIAFAKEINQLIDELNKLKEN